MKAAKPLELSISSGRYRFLTHRDMCINLKMRDQLTKEELPHIIAEI